MRLLAKDGKEVNLHHLTQDEPGAMAEVSRSVHSSLDRVLHMYTRWFALQVFLQSYYFAVIF
ncbi:HNH/ENDO VII family nuclease [Pseudomonas vlassakiae]|uniref:HNH/ENDO VII family nuclease n=1 Tax=Pseudomonas vlassakiae TaxID=485888 RepID=UPI0021C66EDC|nr:HNH/ENDO VII family nuclease [Pseudomonas vlassakiae]MCU0124935.1 HNH/ENDO VII family nuclease [Pseudomonas vlassakiae]